MKKFLSTLLAFVMIFTMSVPAFADNEDDGDVRVTHFFTDQPHTDKNFNDIEYEYVDPAELEKAGEELLEFAKDEANADKFNERFVEFKDRVFYTYAMYQIIKIRADLDYTDEAVANEVERAYESIQLGFIAFNTLVSEVLKLDNACSKVLSSQMTEEDIADYLAYEQPSEELLALQSEEQKLEAEYQTVAHTNYTTTINGKEYDADGVYDAYFTDKEITLEEYLQGCHETYGPYGDLYLRMLDVRQQIAKLNGYDNYAEYAYAEVYDRDFTAEEIDSFRQAVKQDLIPAFKKWSNLLPLYDLDNLPLPDSAYTGEGVFDTLRPFFGKMSSELLETLNAVHDKGFYNITADEKKADRGYSWMISYYNMPFYYNYPYGNIQDLLTTIHELGHNNKAYWDPNDWTDASVGIDLAEVHSQGLELLMTHYYPEIFGEQAEGLHASQIYSMLQGAILSGCLHDEIQYYAYTTPNVTFEMICQRYRELAEEYGNVPSTDPRPEMYGWTSVHHTFDQPMYYISYAVSASGAFMFWEESQHDFFKAVDHYLEFCAQPNTLGFLSTFTESGMESPISPEYVKALAKTLDERMFFVGPFHDMKPDHWAADYVYFCYKYGIVNGTTTSTFTPDGTTTREQGMTILARMVNALVGGDDTYTLDEGVAWAVENEVCDGSDPHGALTREQLALMFFNLAKALELEPDEAGDLSQFSDAATVSEDCQEAITWAVGAGLINGIDGALAPQNTTTRAQFATLIYRFIFEYIYA